MRSDAEPASQCYQHFRAGPNAARRVGSRDRELASAFRSNQHRSRARRIFRGLKEQRAAIRVRRQAEPRPLEEVWFPKKPQIATGALCYAGSVIGFATITVSGITMNARCRAVPCRPLAGKWYDAEADKRRDCLSPLALDEWRTGEPFRKNQTRFYGSYDVRGIYCSGRRCRPPRYYALCPYRARTRSIRGIGEIRGAVAVLRGAGMLEFGMANPIDCSLLSPLSNTGWRSSSTWDRH